MKQKCRICQNIFDYCDLCAIVKNPFKNAGYCDEDCYHISMILQEYVCKNITFEEAAEKLTLHNISNKSLSPELQKIYDEIWDLNEKKIRKEKRKRKEIVLEEDVEVVMNNDNKDITISEIE